MCVSVWWSNYLFHVTLFLRHLRVDSINIYTGDSLIGMRRDHCQQIIILIQLPGHHLNRITILLSAGWRLVDFWCNLFGNPIELLSVGSLYQRLCVNSTIDVVKKSLKLQRRDDSINRSYIIS